MVKTTGENMGKSDNGNMTWLPINLNSYKILTQCGSSIYCTEQSGKNQKTVHNSAMYYFGMVWYGMVWYELD